jgi:hypothetical protein
MFSRNFEPVHKAYKPVYVKFRETLDLFVPVHNLVELVQEAPKNFETVLHTVESVQIL